MVLHAPSNDTIAAVSTPPGEGALGIVRLSGPKAISVADILFRSKSGRYVKDQKNFQARYGRVVGIDSSGAERTLDEGIVLVMRGPRSFTGEDVVEISVHGGTAVLSAVIEAAVRAGARLAEPGEYTKRAFLNGRLDLVQAEAVLDLIVSKTEKGRQWAAARLGGELSTKAASLRDELIGMLSRLEAVIDFPEDVPAASSAGTLEHLARLETQARRMLEGSELGLMAKRGLQVALWGRPNVGKSSLMNRLLGQDRVIVTPYPGTTRDVIEEETQVGGFPVRFCDTAGMGETSQPIEKEGMERSKKAAWASDLVLFVVDSSAEWGPKEEDLLSQILSKPTLVVLNKTDLPRRVPQLFLKGSAKDLSVIHCSCQTENGVEGVREGVFNFIKKGQASLPDETVVGTVRQKDLLEKVLEDISRAGEASSSGLSPEFIAADVRLALEHLSELVGETINDDILEALFSQFCIGK